MTVLMEDDVAIVRHIFQANEVNSEGKTSVLKLGLMLIWVKEKKKVEADGPAGGEGDVVNGLWFFVSGS